MDFVAAVLVVHLPLCVHIAFDVAPLRVLDPRLQFVQIDEAIRILVDFVRNHAAARSSSSMMDGTKHRVVKYLCQRKNALRTACAPNVTGNVRFVQIVRDKTRKLYRALCGLRFACVAKALQTRTMSQQRRVDERRRRMVLINPHRQHRQDEKQLHTLHNIMLRALLCSQFAHNLHACRVPLFRPAYSSNARSPEATLTLLRRQLIEGFRLILAEERLVIVLRVVRVVLEVRLMGQLIDDAIVRRIVRLRNGHNDDCRRCERQQCHGGHRPGGEHFGKQARAARSYRWQS